MGLPKEGAVAVCNQLFSMVDGVAMVTTGIGKKARSGPAGQYYGVTGRTYDRKQSKRPRSEKKRVLEEPTFNYLGLGTTKG